MFCVINIIESVLLDMLEYHVFSPLEAQVLSPSAQYKLCQARNKDFIQTLHLVGSAINIKFFSKTLFFKHFLIENKNREYPLKPPLVQHATETSSILSLFVCLLFTLHVRIFVSRKFLISNKKRHVFILLRITDYWFRIKTLKKLFATLVLIQL